MATAPVGGYYTSRNKTPEMSKEASITQRVASFAKGFFTAIANIFISAFHLMTLNLFKPLTEKQIFSSRVELFKKNPLKATAYDCQEVFDRLIPALKIVIATKVGAIDYFTAKRNLFVNGLTYLKYWFKYPNPKLQMSIDRGFAMIKENPAVAKMPLSLICKASDLQNYVSIFR